MALPLLTCGCLTKSAGITLPVFTLKYGLPSLAQRFIHQSPPDHFPKYNNVRKKVRIHGEKHAAMKAKYDRLDMEDQPTGCLLCPHRNPDINIDYKNVRLLSQFISPHTGRMYGRRITGLCGTKQIELTHAIKRARKIGLMPITMKYFDYHADPKLF